MCQPSSATHRRGVYASQVVRNVKLCDEHFLLHLWLDAFPPTRPGQFVQLACRDQAPQVDLHEITWSPDRPPQLSQPELMGTEPMLRRPISLAGRHDLDEGVELVFIYRAIGTATRWLAGAKEGQPLSVLGPLGNAFPVSPTKRFAVLVGGGVGIPPMLYLAADLAGAGKQVTAFSGARTASLLPLKPNGPVPTQPRGEYCIEEFAERGARAVVATDDGSIGFHGLVTVAMDRWLEAGAVDPAELVAYSCGPEPMMRGLAELCAARGIECYLALERYMACGMGTCQSCVVKIADDTPRGWSFKLCCTDGPVFPARSVLWG